MLMAEKQDYCLDANQVDIRDQQLQNFSAK
jgi:hypothetical protein